MRFIYFSNNLPLGILINVLILYQLEECGPFKKRETPTFSYFTCHITEMNANIHKVLLLKNSLSLSHIATVSIIEQTHLLMI